MWSAIVAKASPEAIAIVVAVVLAVIGLIVAASVADKRRRRALVELLRQQGFTVVDDLAKHDRNALFAVFNSLGPLKNGASGLRWHAVKHSGAGAACRHIEIVEHVHTVGSGKNQQTIVNTCAAVIGGASWPLLMLEREGIWARVAERLGAKPDLKLENDEFNKRWRVRCDDESFAIAVLSPEMQELLAAVERPQLWLAIGGPSGIVCVGTRAALKPATLGALLERVERLVQAIPAEARSALGL